MEGYQVVYSTLAGDLYDKVIVPRNEGVTTKTTLTGKLERAFIPSAVSFSCYLSLVRVFAQSDVFPHAVIIIPVHLMCSEEATVFVCITRQDYLQSKHSAGSLLIISVEMLVVLRAY